MTDYRERVEMDDGKKPHDVHVSGGELVHAAGLTTAEQDGGVEHLGILARRHRRRAPVGPDDRRFRASAGRWVEPPSDGRGGGGAFHGLEHRRAHQRLVERRGVFAVALLRSKAGAPVFIRRGLLYLALIALIVVFIVQAIPDELLGSARIDGSSEFGTFRRVVLPLLRPSLGALAVWSFLQSCNSFMWPLAIISNSQQYTLPLGLNILCASENRSFDLVLAGAVLASIPTILVFILLRKQLLEGLVAGAVKG